MQPGGSVRGKQETTHGGTFSAGDRTELRSGKVIGCWRTRIEAGRVWVQGRRCGPLQGPVLDAGAGAGLVGREWAKRCSERLGEELDRTQADGKEELRDRRQ